MIPTNSIAIVANGDIHDYSTTASLIKQHIKVIAVDGGLAHCAKMNLTPDLMIGDFDSISSELQKRFSKIPSKRVPREKDHTDLELAIQEVDHPEVERITLFGALGMRSDHSLYNIQLLGKFPCHLFIETEWETLFAIEGNFHVPCDVGQRISLMPLGKPAEGVITRGLEWELHNATIDSSFVSLSNVCLQAPVQVTVTHGQLLCILQRQK